CLHREMRKKKKQPKPSRKLPAAILIVDGVKYDLPALAKKFGVPKVDVRRAITAFGADHQLVEGALKRIRAETGRRIRHRRPKGQNILRANDSSPTRQATQRGKMANGASRGKSLAAKSRY